MPSKGCSRRLPGGACMLVVGHGKRAPPNQSATVATGKGSKRQKRPNNPNAVPPRALLPNRAIPQPCHEVCGTMGKRFARKAQINAHNGGNRIDRTNATIGVLPANGTHDRQGVVMGDRPFWCGHPNNAQPPARFALFNEPVFHKDKSTKRRCAVTRSVQKGNHRHANCHLEGRHNEVFHGNNATCNRTIPGGRSLACPESTGRVAICTYAPHPPDSAPSPNHQDTEGGQLMPPGALMFAWLLELHRNGGHGTQDTTWRKLSNELLLHNKEPDHTTPPTFVQGAIPTRCTPPTDNECFLAINRVMAGVGDCIEEALCAFLVGQHKQPWQLATHLSPTKTLGVHEMRSLLGGQRDPAACHYFEQALQTTTDGLQSMRVISFEAINQTNMAGRALEIYRSVNVLCNLGALPRVHAFLHTGANGLQFSFLATAADIEVCQTGIQAQLAAIGVLPMVQSLAKQVAFICTNHKAALALRWRCASAIALSLACRTGGGAGAALRGTLLCKLTTPPAQTLRQATNNICLVVVAGVLCGTSLEDRARSLQAKISQILAKPLPPPKPPPPPPKPQTRDTPRPRPPRAPPPPMAPPPTIERLVTFLCPTPIHDHQLASDATRGFPTISTGPLETNLPPESAELFLRAAFVPLATTHYVNHLVTPNALKYAQVDDKLTLRISKMLPGTPRHVHKPSLPIEFDASTLETELNTFNGAAVGDLSKMTDRKQLEFRDNIGVCLNKSEEAKIRGHLSHVALADDQTQNQYIKFIS